MHRNAKELMANITQLAFRLAKSVDQPSVLWIVWGREDNVWKIIAYHVLTP
jgi:hypothetical protein